ncbi:hypothetical protein [Zestomonas carbonaria]|uniref:Uncharacterized protein n=1 Tax=Zestomonas carbonaria TaxID=2762745 RepID=A0A7U7EQD9_9GAMM|nr:hypothetical protein [Pseudomonas carbonaria]CAD5108772.1 hypothetical protein PSEWESI4_03064 [Pseudomonas carbonaria]
MRITLVKKVLADGQDCRKCRDVLQQLERRGLLGRIDRILVADERDPGSTGWMVAQHYGVDSAPFFVVRHDDGSERVYTVFLALLHEVLEPKAGQEPGESAQQLAELAKRDGLDRL